MTCVSGERGNRSSISGGSKMFISSGLPIRAPVFSTSLASISTSPGAEGQRPSITSPAHTSSRDQKVTAPRSALYSSDSRVAVGSPHGPSLRASDSAIARSMASFGSSGPLGVNTRASPVDAAGASWSRVTT